MFEPDWDRLERLRASGALTAKMRASRVSRHVRKTTVGEGARASQKAAAREIAVDLRKRGLSPMRISTILQARNIVRPGGKPWTQSAVEHLLKAPAADSA